MRHLETRAGNPRIFNKNNLHRLQNQIGCCLCLVCTPVRWALLFEKATKLIWASQEKYYLDNNVPLAASNNAAGSAAHDNAAAHVSLTLFFVLPIYISRISGWIHASDREVSF